MGWGKLGQHWTRASLKDMSGKRNKNGRNKIIEVIQLSSCLAMASKKPLKAFITSKPNKTVSYRLRGVISNQGLKHLTDLKAWTNKRMCLNNIYEICRTIDPKDFGKKIKGTYEPIEIGTFGSEKRKSIICCTDGSANPNPGFAGYGIYWK